MIINCTKYGYHLPSGPEQCFLVYLALTLWNCVGRIPVYLASLFNVYHGTVTEMCSTENFGPGPIFQEKS